MENITLILIGMVFANMILYMLGRKESKKQAGYILSIEKEYIFHKLCPIGFGVMRIVPAIKKIYIEDVYQLYRARMDEYDEIQAHWNFFLAQNIAIFMSMPFIITMFIVLAVQNGKGDSAELIGAVGVIMMIGMVANSTVSMKHNENERIEEIKEELPDLINRIVILLNSGMPMIKVFQNVGTMEDGPLQEELHRVILDISNHKDVVYALSRMQRRCHCYEVSRLYNIVEIAITKGASGVGDTLTSLALELWENKRNNVKKKSANLSQKLMLPTIALFFVIIVIVAAPAFMEMNNF